MNQADLPNTAAGDMPHELIPLSFPLSGSRLIEASAGTGKTWTIAALYVRLVLGHGDDNAYLRALTPPEILVVTFTEAATQELRDRIRSRLAEAASFFMQSPASDLQDNTAESFLHELKDAYPPDAWATCARKLQLAAEWMDEAAVSTIHGWCNRMLREHAFDSNSLFDLQLERDQTELQAEVVRDYWRTFIVTLDADLAAELRLWWPGPAELQHQLQALVAHAGLLDMAKAPAHCMSVVQDERLTLMGQLKEPWPDWADQLQDLLDEAVDKKWVDGRKIQARFYLPWLQALRVWAQDPTLMEPALTNSAWFRLSAEGIHEAWKQGDVPEHEAITAITELHAALANLPSARNDVLCHATHWVAQRFAAEQARHAQMGLDELLTGLDQALQGPNGERLAATIRLQFPVVLIDEFQDTDPVQYRIYDSIYRIADNHPDTGVILIGDPKQAIYGFRGADIYTYLAARQAAAGRLYTLKKNFRSSAAMVAASNRFFEFAESRSGSGAFLFRQGTHNPLPFVSAQARGRDDVLSIGAAAQPALTIWQAESGEKSLTKDGVQTQMATACANEIGRLLRMAQDGLAGFQDGDELHPLRPADIAILVNNRTEAQAVRSALSRLGIRSVYLSDQDSVLQSNQVDQLACWLQACAEPDDGRRLRAALATPTLGLGWAELNDLNNDEALWEHRVLQFRNYRECWRKQGVLPMLRRLLSDFHVPARLLHPTGAQADAAGERALTDILHLAELLQQASALVDGEHALIRYLLEQQQLPPSARRNEALQIRLESDADLIKVVTVHKSKGLEYPLVFLPFAWNFRPTKPDDLPLKYHDDNGRLQLALTSTPAIQQQVDNERLGEDLRKLYVALTRARYATWLGVAPLSDQERSATGYLLGLASPVSEQSLATALAQLADGHDAIAINTAPKAAMRPLEQNIPTEIAGAARLPQRSVREQWWIASYSSIAAQRTTVAGGPAYGNDHSPETSAQDVFAEVQADMPPSEPIWPELSESHTPAQFSFGLLHDFPRGPDAGSFLHDLLEWAADQGFAHLGSIPELVRDTVARRCTLRGWQAWIDPLTRWLLEFVSVPFRLEAAHGVSATEFSLAGLETRIPEMEFWIAAQTVQIQAMDTYICRSTLAGMPRPPLMPSEMNGMLKGFIDLVFMHEGRYYVADYKSNWLGDNDMSYTQEAMERVIAQSRYDLQYVLYLLALHRLLKIRLPGYDYDQHIGGAVYFFLRGLHAPGQGIYAERPPKTLIQALDDMFAGKQIVTDRGAA